MTDPGLPPHKRGFDLTFNLGHAIIIATGIVGLIGSHYLSDYRLAALERQSASIQFKIDGFAGLLIDNAVTAQRVKEMERRLELVERK